MRITWMKGLLITYVLTYGGAAAALVNPYYGFLIYVAFGIARPPAMWWWSVPEGNYSRIIALGLLAGWVMRGFGSWNFGKAREILVSLGIFWAVTLASTLAAPDAATAWLYFEQLSKILLPLVAGVTLIDSAGKIRQLVWTIALSQGLVAFEMNTSYFSGYNRLYYEGFASLDNNAAAITMVTGAGLTFFLALSEQKWWSKGIAAVLFGLLTHAVMFSFSRGALLSLIVCGGVAFAILPKRPLYLAAFALAAILGARLAGNEVLARFGTTFVEKEERDDSATSRLALWKGCLSEMLDNPLLGIGPDHWKHVAHHHGFQRGKAAHSMWMQTGAESGAIAFTALIAFYGLTIWRLWRLLLRDSDSVDPELVATARMVVCSLCGFVVAAQFVSVNLVEISYYVAAAGIGALKLVSVSPQEAEDDALNGDEFFELERPVEWQTA